MSIILPFLHTAIVLIATNGVSISLQRHTLTKRCPHARLWRERETSFILRMYIAGAPISSFLGVLREESSSSKFSRKRRNRALQSSMLTFVPQTNVWIGSLGASLILTEGVPGEEEEKRTMHSSSDVPFSLSLPPSPARTLHWLADQSHALPNSFEYLGA